MFFVNYNDYELLYLVREGSEQALNILYQKYLVLINKISFKYYSNGDKREDLIQEGVILLFKSIFSYKMTAQTSFYVYFYIILHRGFNVLVKNDYYSNKVVLCEDIVAYTPNYSKASFIKNLGYKRLKDELDLRIYEECLLENASVKYFADKYHLKTTKVAYRLKTILEDLKNILTKDKK